MPNKKILNKQKQPSAINIFMFIGFSVFVVVLKYPYLHNNFMDFYVQIQTFWKNIAFCKVLKDTFIVKLLS